MVKANGSRLSNVSLLEIASGLHIFSMAVSAVLDTLLLLCTMKLKIISAA